MYFRASTLVLLLLISSRSLVYAQAGPFDTTVHFDGFNAVLVQNRSGSIAPAVRVVLVDSDFEKNPHKMKHVPTIEFLAPTRVGPAECVTEPCWRSRTPHFVRTDDDDHIWRGWYLHETLVKFLPEPPPQETVNLASLKYVLKLKDYHDDDPLGHADPKVWHGVDAQTREKRVISQVLLKSGSMTSTTVDGKVNDTEVRLAKTVRWNGRVNYVALTDLRNQARELRIPIVGEGAIVKIRNVPVGQLENPKRAHHVGGYYFLTMSRNPSNHTAVEVWDLSGPLNETVFCPPVELDFP